MSFVQPAYVWFLLVFLAVYWSLGHRAQNRVIVLASAIFYGWVHPWFVALLWGSAALDFVCARSITHNPGFKGRWLALSLIGNGLTLGVFKYFGFFVENVRAVLDVIGLPSGGWTLEVLLPVGISFYTFQTVGYTIDVYRGNARARDNFVDFLAFVSFFPQLVAGPIERAERLLPQIERPRTFSVENLQSGLGLALWGAFKKVVIADTVGSHVDAVYAVDDPSWSMAWAGCIGFMVQILADFTGYTDIARGTARMLGFELVENFRHPYLARSPFDLWNRWHISLSEWLRDYVYYPASAWKWGRRWLRIPGVRESGTTIFVRATLLTMLFSGLWHGAAWHFVLWGAWWAVVQIAWMFGSRKLPRRVRTWKHAVWAQLALMAPVHLVMGQLFREPDISRLPGYFFGNPLANTVDQNVIAGITLSFALVGATLLVLAMGFEMFVLPRLRGTLAWPPVRNTLWALAAWAIFSFAQFRQDPFVYFAF